MNSDVYVKKAKLVKELKENNVNYDIEEREDEFVFRIRYTMCGQRVLVALVLDETVYNDCHIYFGELKDNTKKEQILNLMNQINDDYRIEKFYMSDDVLVEECTYISETKNFNANLFMNFVNFNLDQLQDKHLKQFMKIIWS